MRELPSQFIRYVSASTQLSVLLELPGAVPGEDEDASVAAHYGDPLREQRTLAESAGLVDRSNREILVVDGPDRLSWLNDLTTQKVDDLIDGQSTETLVLSPNGHIEHHAAVTEIGGRIWLDVENGTADGLLSFLESMRFMLRVEPLAVTDVWALLTIAGPMSSAVLTEADVAPPAAIGGALALPSGGWVRAAPSTTSDSSSFDLLIPRGELRDWTTTLFAAGASPVGMSAYDALRVEARRPRHGFETDHKTIPNELPWIRTALHLAKGCYRGQETVARVHNLGRPPRRIALVHLDGVSETLPGRRTDITWDGRTVGSVTTSAWHYELGPIALVSLKRNVPDNAELLVAGTTARIDSDPDEPSDDVIPAGRAARDRLTGRDRSATIRA